MPIPLRGDFDAARVRAIARRSKDAPQARRLLALATIYDGAMRTLGWQSHGIGKIDLAAPGLYLVEKI